MRTQAWLSSRQSTTHDTEFGEERHRETSARNGYRLSSFADGSDGADCPNIGTDGECCRCIGQALIFFLVSISLVQPQPYFSLSNSQTRKMLHKQPQIIPFTQPCEQYVIFPIWNRKI